MGLFEYLQGRASRPNPWALPSRAFTAEEGRSLAVLDALLGVGRGDATTVPAILRTLPEDLAAVGARRMATRVMRFLVEGGGWRERTLLRPGGSVRARVWDGEASQGFVPRFTRASRTLWVEGAARLPARVGRTDVDPGLGPALVPGPSQETDTGDWVIFHLAQQSLETFRLGNEDRMRLRARLLSASPVARLLTPGDEGTRAEMRQTFARLFDPGRVRVLECMEDRVAQAWSGTARTLGTELRAAPLPASTQRWAALGRALDGYLDAAEAAERLDLARPVMALVTALVTEVFPSPPETVRAELSRTPGIARLAQRDELLAAVGSVAAIGARLFSLRAQMAEERYGDPRHAEAQVFLGDVDRRLAGQRRTVEGLSQALSGLLG